DPPDARRRAGRRDGRSRARPDPDRLLRGEGLGHRGDPPGRRGVQPSHGPLEARGARTAADDADRQPAPRGHALGPAPRARRRAVRLGRPRHLAHLVDGCGRPPEPDLPGAAGPDLGHARLAPGRAREARRAGRPARRRVGRHGEVARGVRRVARADAAGRAVLARRHAPAVLAAASAQARARGLPAAGGPGPLVRLRAGESEPTGVLLRALAVGLLGGSAGVVLRFLATEAPRLVWPGPDMVQGVALTPPLARALVPAVGGLVGGL